jgi:hypothetical protein
VELNANACKILVGKREGKRPLGTIGDGGRITKWILKKQDRGIWAGLIWLRDRN